MDWQCALKPATSLCDHLCHFSNHHSASECVAKEGKITILIHLTGLLSINLQSTEGITHTELHVLSISFRQIRARIAYLISIIL